MKIFDSFSGEKKIMILVILAYFFSSTIQWSFDSQLKVKEIYFGLPHVYSGDEPEYLVSINSLLFDSDFKLCNNYLQAMNGGSQAGIMYSGIKQIIPEECLLGKERLPTRSILSAVFALAFLWQFKQLPLLIEPLSILLTLLASIATIFFAMKIFAHFGFSKKTILLCVFILAFASPFWFYSKSLWTENILALFFTLSIYCLLKKRFFLSGFFSSFAILLKPTALLIAAILFLAAFFLKKKQWFFSVGFALALSIFFLINYIVFRDLFFFSKANVAFGGNILQGLIAMLFAPNFGLLLSFPLFLFSIIGFRDFLKKKKFDSVVFLAIIVLYALFWAQAPWIVFGTGGFSFRYLAPLLPIMLVPIGFFLENNKSALLRKCFFALLVISLVVNAVAALSPLLVNNAPWKPLELLLGLLH